MVEGWGSSFFYDTIWKPGVERASSLLGHSQPAPTRDQAAQEAALRQGLDGAAEAHALAVLGQMGQLQVCVLKQEKRVL